MVTATCSCRSGLASLFLVAARQTAAVLLLWQLRPGTRIARLGAQAGLAVVFSSRAQRGIPTIFKEVYRENNRHIETLHAADLFDRETSRRTRSSTRDRVPSLHSG